MTAQYNKVIIQEVEGDKKVAIIFDETTHTPISYKLVKCGMDDFLEILNNPQKNG